MQPRQQARLDDLDDDTSPPIELEQRSLPEYLLEKASAKSELVTLDKFTATTRIGIGLRHDMPERAVVYTVASGTPADGTIHPYDEILAIGGTPCESAIHRGLDDPRGPAGPLEIEVVPCPAELEQASSRAGAALRAAAARRLGLSRRVINKPSLDTPLGLSFSPDYLVHSVIRAVKEGGLAATALKEATASSGSTASDARRPPTRRACSARAAAASSSSSRWRRGWIWRACAWSRRRRGWRRRRHWPRRRSGGYAATSRQSRPTVSMLRRRE